MHSTSRLAGLSDGVFSIAMTLLVLNIELPSHTTSANLATELLSLGHNYFAYALSFVVIGLFWSWHHSFIEPIRLVTRPIVFLNLFFLMFVSFLPFSTSVISDYPTTTASTIFYLSSLFAVGLVRYGFTEYVLRSKTYDEDMLPREQRITNVSFIVILVITMGIAFINPDAALISLNLIWIVAFFSRGR